MASALGCDGNMMQVQPPNDYYLCPSTSGNHLRQAYNDATNFTVHSISVRQLFDFTDRTGTFAFDVDGWFTPGHGTWLELWVTDEPIPVPYQSAPSVQATPRNAIGFELRHDGCSQDATRNGVSTVFIVKDFDLVRTLASGDFAESNCYRTARAAINHIELRLSRTSLELVATDAGNASSLHRVALINGLDLNFTRGFVHVQHSHYNAAKDGHPASETHLYDNFAFDGPAYVLPRTYEIRDSLEAGREGNVNVGYSAAGGRTVSFQVPGVDVSNVQSGTLNFTVTNFMPGMSIRHRFNGGTWRTLAHPFPDSSDSWRSLSIPITTSDLRAGANTLEVSVQGSNDFTTLANLDVQLIPGG